MAALSLFQSHFCKHSSCKSFNRYGCLFHGYFDKYKQNWTHMDCVEYQNNYRRLRRRYENVCESSLAKQLVMKSKMDEFQYKNVTIIYVISYHLISFESCVWCFRLRLENGLTSQLPSWKYINFVLTNKFFLHILFACKYFPSNIIGTFHSRLSKHLGPLLFI